MIFIILLLMSAINQDGSPVDDQIIMFKHARRLSHKCIGDGWCCESIQCGYGVEKCVDPANTGKSCRALNANKVDCLQQGWGASSITADVNINSGIQSIMTGYGDRITPDPDICIPNSCSLSHSSGDSSLIDCVTQDSSVVGQFNIDTDTCNTPGSTAGLLLSCTYKYTTSDTFPTVIPDWLTAGLTFVAENNQRLDVNINGADCQGALTQMTIANDIGQIEFDKDKSKKYVLTMDQIATTSLPTACPISIELLNHLLENITDGIYLDAGGIFVNPSMYLSTTYLRLKITSGHYTVTTPTNTNQKWSIKCQNVISQNILVGNREFDIGTETQKVIIPVSSFYNAPDCNPGLNLVSITQSNLNYTGSFIQIVGGNLVFDSTVPTNTQWRVMNYQGRAQAAWGSRWFRIITLCPTMTISTIANINLNLGSDTALVVLLQAQIGSVTTDSPGCQISNFELYSGSQAYTGDAVSLVNNSLVVNTAIDTDETLKIKLTQASTSVFTNVFTVKVACPQSLTLITLASIFENSVPENTTDLTTTNMLQLFSNTAIHNSLGVQACQTQTYALLALAGEDWEDYTGDWVTIGAAGEVSVNLHQTGSQSFKIKTVYGEQDYVSNEFTVRVNCGAIKPMFYDDSQVIMPHIINYNATNDGGKGKQDLLNFIGMDHLFVDFQPVCKDILSQITVGFALLNATTLTDFGIKENGTKMFDVAGRDNNSSPILLDFDEITSPQPKNISQEVEFQVNATLFNGTVYSRKVQVLINYYYCPNKTIDVIKEGPHRTFMYMKNPQVPANTQLNISEYINQTDSQCTVNYTILMDKNDLTSAPTTEQQALLSIATDSDNVTKLLQMVPSAPSNLTFYVQAHSIFNSFFQPDQFVEFNFEVSPCDSSIEQITNAADFSKYTYFKQIDKETSDVVYELTTGTVTEEHMKASKASIEFPLFTQKYLAACPLTYSLSSANDTFTNYTNLNVTMGNESLGVDIDLTVKEQSWSFYMYAINSANKTHFSQKITIIQSPICNSELVKMKDNATLTSASETIYISDFDSVNTFVNTTLYTNWSKDASFDTMADKQCPLIDPFLAVSSTAKSGTNLTQMTYDISQNLKVEIPATDAYKGIMFSVNLATGGFQETGIAILKDASGASLSLNYTFNVCGDNFYDTTVCTRASEEVLPLINFAPVLQPTPEDISVEDLWETYDQVFNFGSGDFDAESLKLSYEIGTAADPEEAAVTIKYEMATALGEIVTFEESGGAIKMLIDMQAFYASGLMPDMDTEVSEEVQIIVSDGELKADFKFNINFAAKVEYKEEVKEPEPVEEEKEEIAAFVPDFTKVKEVKPKANVPVAVADTSIPAAERTNPQISGVNVGALGDVEVIFSKPMKYPTNWVSKYLSDSGASSIDESLKDTISTPLLKFWFEFVVTSLQQELPQEDCKITSLEATRVGFLISFKSLDNPDAISLDSGTDQDLLIIQIPKTLILNGAGEDGESLVLDKADFEEEDASSFFSSAELQPQYIEPKTANTKSVQGAADAGPSVTAAGTGAGVMGALVGAPPTGLSDTMSGEQGSAANSALKTIQPGNLNGFNQQMSKTASADYKAVDLLSARNMTWTSKSTSNQGLKRMGVTQRNFPKAVGSTVITGAAGAAGVGGGSMAVGAVSSLLLEGGKPDVSMKEQVLMIKKKLSMQGKVPMTPIYNAFIGIILMKILLGGVTNAENSYLFEWKNFGADGNLSMGDQLSIIAGNLGLILGLVLLVMITLNLVCDIKWMFNFGKKAVGIENLLRRKTNHKMLMFSMGQFRTFFTVFLICYVTLPTFAVPQLLLSIVVNPSNVLLGLNLKPLPMFGCLNLTKLLRLTDCIAILILYHQLMQTEVNPPGVPSKISIGFLVLLLSQSKLYLGKMNMFSQQILHQKVRLWKLVNFIRGLFCCCPTFQGKGGKKYTESEKFFLMSRKDLVERYRFQLRANSYKNPITTVNGDSIKKVSPFEAFKRVKAKRDPEANMYEMRENKAHKIAMTFKPGRMYSHVVDKAIRVKKTLRNKVNLEEVLESKSINEATFSFTNSEQMSNVNEDNTAAITPREIIFKVQQHHH